MNNNLGQVAGQKALKEIEKISQNFINREVRLLNSTKKNDISDKTNVEGGLYLDFSKLKGANKKKSIIWSSIRNLVKCEDIQSQAFLLLIESSKSYFFYTFRDGSQVLKVNQDGEYGGGAFLKDKQLNYNCEKLKFSIFAKNYISQKIKEYFNRENNLNGCDTTEKIHTHIRNIREKNIQLGYRNALNSVHLSYPEAKDLAQLYNKKIKVIFELESIQFGKVANWKITSEEEKDLEIPTWDLSPKAYSKDTFKEKDEYDGLEIDENIIKRQNKSLLKKSIKDFLKICDPREKIIFINRILKYKNEQPKLKNLSIELGISQQRVFTIEKSLLEKFLIFAKKKYFYKVENKKAVGIN